MKLYWIAAPVIVGGGMAACGDGDGAAGSATTAVPDESAAYPVVAFDGDACTNSGPNEITAGGLISVALENTSDIDIDAGLYRVRSKDSLEAAFDRLPAGTGSDIHLGIPPGAVQEAWLQASAADSNEESLLLPPGWYLLDSARIPYGDSAPDYVWRGGGFEVVPEE